MAHRGAQTYVGLADLAAKAAIIIIVASILLLPAWRLIFVERAVLWLDIAFVLTIGISAMNGIVAIPRTPYLLTFLCLTFLYSSIKLADGMDHPRCREADQRPLDKQS